MTEQPYSKREIDNFHGHITEKLESILEQVKKTNGKVKKIIIALVFLGGTVIGMLFDAKEIAQIILGRFI